MSALLAPSPTTHGCRAHHILYGIIPRLHGTKGLPRLHGTKGLTGVRELAVPSIKSKDVLSTGSACSNTLTCTRLSFSLSSTHP